MTVTIETTPAMLAQLARADTLADSLIEVTALDILDALAVAGYTLEESKEGNPASEMYISIIAGNNA